MRQIVSGLEFLHSNKIIHRDLKLDNILVNFNSEEDKRHLNMERAQAKIIDFGFATILKQSKANLTYTVLGTPSNMDPQLLQNMETHTRNIQGYDDKADIWSLGTLCYEMLVGHTAFSCTSMQDLYQKVKQGTYTLPANLSEEVVSFINSMLVKDPNKRLSAKELMKHDFLVKNISQFKPVDVKKLAVKVGPGGMMNFNSNTGNNVKNLHETVWDIFSEPISVQPQNIPNRIPGQQKYYNVNQNNVQYNYMVPNMVPQQKQYQQQYIPSNNGGFPSNQINYY